MNTLPKKVAATLLLVLAPALALVGAWALRDRVPDPLPRHWNLAGDVDGTTGFVAFSALVLGTTAVLAVVGLALVWAVKDRQVAGFSAPLTGWLVWFLSVLYVGTLVASRDVARAEDVSLPMLAVGAALVVSVVVALLMVKLVPAVRSQEDGVTARGSSLTLGEGERVVWVGTAGSRTFLLIGVLVALAGAVVLTLVGLGGLLPMVIGLAMMWSHSITVRVDDAGVHVVWGPLGWPGGSTALSEIAGVETTVVRPGEWGGWGYRMSSKGSAHLVRGGEGLVLHRHGRKDLLITVDRAEQGRDVLAALLERRDATA